MSKNIKKNFYERLGISDDSASPSEIKKAYRKLAKEHHPDSGGDEDSFASINEAYNILSNPETRAMYDAGEDVNSYLTGEKKAKKRLCEVMNYVIERPTFMADHTDVIVRMREEINETTIKMHSDLENNAIEIRKKKAIKDRLKKAPFLEAYIAETIEFLEEKEKTIIKDLECQDIMLELLSDSSYAFDEDTEDPMLLERDTWDE